MDISDFKVLIVRIAGKRPVVYALTHQKPIQTLRVCLHQTINDQPVQTHAINVDGTDKRRATKANIRRMKCCKDITGNRQIIVRQYREVIISVVIGSIGQPS